MFTKSKCVQCGTCIKACHANAIRLSEKATVIDDLSKCDLCGECINHCPSKSIKFVGDNTSVDEIVSEVVKDEIFYYTSGGGVTISGGEPFYQPEFLMSLLKALSSRGIDTAIETCGVTDTDTFAEGISMVDRVLMDLKHIDDKKHTEWTGGSCEIILENWHTLARTKKNAICRIPVIPGFNDTVDEIEQMSEFIGSLGIKEIHLLAYHNFGKSKYEGLNRQYPMGNTSGIPDEKMKELQKTASKYVQYVQIGG